MKLICRFGEMWARNQVNINEVPGSKESGKGIYILYDGSMPVYVGKSGGGKSSIHRRIVRVRPEVLSGITSAGTFWIIRN